MKLPNYSHRSFAGGLDNPEKFDITDLVDSIGLSIETAEAVLLQMQNQYVGECERNTAGTNFSILETVRKELLDIKVLVEWFNDKERGAGDE